MHTQPEQVLEDNLIKQLSENGYQKISIKDEQGLLSNLKEQLEKHNNTSFTQNEFKRILIHLNKGNVFERSKILRDRMQLTKDNGDCEYIEFIEQENWCQNTFQVTQQVKMEGSHKNRYDVTLLINGFPLVQIELKRRGSELKEAYNQIDRYQKHSYWASNGLFQYVQLFVISNGENTKYFANNGQKQSSYKFTYNWTDEKNKPVNLLSAFANEFLERCHLSKMICRYIVLNETQKLLMVLRPYQFYAVEAIVHQVLNTNKNGYIWHTTGSGKTLTSFKASQILTRLPNVDKVVFVVDRKDLDYQTQTEFDAFQKGSVADTTNTNELVKQFNNSAKLIITTIQKLNNAINSKPYLSKMEQHKEENIVFIFDECHRSQFGDTHKAIKNYFINNQMIGFTGTPIFEKNAVNKESVKYTTGALFGKPLHEYVITNAISDQNVLRFAIEYVGRYRQKESANEIDIEVEDIDTDELMESEQRLSKIVDYIIANHDYKTQNRNFTAMFCVNSVDTLIKYYDLFKKRKEEGKHNLNIATIFTYTANEPSKESDGRIYEEEMLMAAESEPAYGNKTQQYAISTHKRDVLESYVQDYNRMYDTRHTVKDSGGFYQYYNDIAKRAKEYEKASFNPKDRVDIILVVNIFLTGFDAKKVNTLYVDKNLKYHGLIQAFSRTNRILDEKKSHGQIVCFRNLKKATDEAIKLFSDINAKDIILMEPYEEYLRKFSQAFGTLLQLTPTKDSVDSLQDEDEELEFVKAFRELMRFRNILKSFADFDWDDLPMSEQSFEDYASKYKDLNEKVRNDKKKNKASILNDVDFELELIHRDEINKAYILKLLAQMKDANKEEHEKQKKEILDMLSTNEQLRSKRELIQQFIEENLPHIEDAEDVPDEFSKFCSEQEVKAIYALCKEEDMDINRFRKLMDDFIFTERTPRRDEVLKTLNGKQPGISQRRPKANQIIEKMKELIDTFVCEG